MKKKTVTYKYHRRIVEAFNLAKENLPRVWRENNKLREDLQAKEKDFADLYKDYRNEKLRRMQAEEARTRLDNKLNKQLEKEVQLEQAKYELEAAVKQLSRLLQENLAKTNFKINVVSADEELNKNLVPYKLPITA